MGLAKGVDRFEPERGFKLSTYVHWWIRQVRPHNDFRFLLAAVF